MSIPEKKKRLEELKRRKREMEDQLKESKEKASITIEDEARKVLKKRDINLERLDIVEHTGNIIRDYIKTKIEKLEPYSFNEFFKSVKKQKYNEGTQCIEREDQRRKIEEDIKDIEEKKEDIKLIYPKFVKSEDDDINLKNKKYESFTIDNIDQYCEEYKNDLDNLVKDEIKVMDRAIKEKGLLSILENHIYKYSSQNYSNQLSESLFPIMEFVDEPCKNKVVTGLEWSPKYPELLLTSYTPVPEEGSNSFNEMKGLVYIWSLENENYPEFTFTCQPVLNTAIFHPFNPKLIIGGTKTGQILVWDTRGKQTPIMKTPLWNGQAKTISEEVNCLGVIGTSNSNHIIAVSTGQITKWDLTKLSSPNKKLDLKKTSHSNTSVTSDTGAETTDGYILRLNPLSMGINQNDTNSIIIGTDDNIICPVYLNSDFLAYKKEDKINYVGHEGPIFSIDFHPQDISNKHNFTHIFATSSADWTTKIWAKNHNKEPLLTIDNSKNYVFCTQWNPKKASVLATGDGDGYLDIFDINKSIEGPKARFKVDGDNGTSTGINKIDWSEDGEKILVGDSGGKTYLLGLKKDLFSYGEENNSDRFAKFIEKCQNDWKEKEKEKKTKEHL